MSSTDPRNERGFTMVELLVTIAVMGFLAVIALPSSSPNQKRKLDTIQLELQDAIDHAQSLAYHTGEKMSCYVNVPSQWFAVVDAQGVPQEDPLSHGIYAVRLSDPGQPTGVSIEYVANPLDRSLVMFDDRGRLVYPVDVVISAGGVQRSLEINTATGLLVEVPMSE
jgi:prepilin-type N-terminal cleavage/methylation domain-containing protein